jgi:hypothetical protein
MVALEALAHAALEQDNLTLRSLVQDLLHQQPEVAAWTAPATRDPQLLAIAAGLAELLAQRLRQPAPAWTTTVGPAPRPHFLLKAAATLKRLRTLCMDEAPEPLRKRRLYAPPNFLEFA